MGYARNVRSWLERFAATFLGVALCDLGKDHLGLWLDSLGELGVKSVNDRRACLAMFFRWATRKDCLPLTHRLLEADAMQREDWQPAGWWARRKRGRGSMCGLGE